MLGKDFFFLIVFLVLLGCKVDSKTKVEKEKMAIEKISDISVKRYSYDDLKPLLHKKNDTVYVVNFWATWCLPCVKELPAFEKLNKEYKDRRVEVLLVSLDFKKQIEKRLLPFIENRKLASKVVVLDDEDEQRWINDISKNWSGAIPATLIYSKDKRKFYEQSFDYNTLENQVKNFLN